LTYGSGVPIPTRLARLARSSLVVLAMCALVAACACNADDSDEPAASTTVSDAFEARLVNELSLTPGEARCVTSRANVLFDAATLQTLASGEADEPSQAVFDDVLAACAFEAATPEDSLVRRPGEPFTYGEDADLDRLWDACADTGTDVCDELFNRSPEGSEYEAFAKSCGGRGVQIACAPGAAGSTPGQSSSGNPVRYGDDPELDRLWDQCAAGDPQACLTLEFQAPAGSEYANFGATCGGQPNGCPGSS
jgi:hypothetical protein